MLLVAPLLASSELIIQGKISSKLLYIAKRSKRMQENVQRSGSSEHWYLCYNNSTVPMIQRKVLFQRLTMRDNSPNLTQWYL